jgi:DNA repair exonuclease SbcCD ATPase subunit
MTVRLSPQKVSKILRCYCGGMPQTEIAKKAGVDQSTVSLYASRFKETAVGIGLLAAGKEFGVFNEVDALRSLSVELSQAHLTVEEAREGVKILKAFLKLGVSPDKHTMLAKVCGEIDDLGFVNAALKLSKIEAESDLGYEQVIAKLEKAKSELPSAEKKLQEVEAKLMASNKALGKKTNELASLEAHIAQLQKDAKDKETELDHELAAKMKQLKVKLGELEQISELKTELAKSGLDIRTLVNLGKEFSDANTKG